MAAKVKIFQCHIVGKTKDSARFLENYPNDKMDTYENMRIGK